MRDLTKTLQALYDSELNVTITTLWDGGVDFALVSYFEYDPETTKLKNVGKYAELADALHAAALEEFPDSAYAKKSGVV